MGIHVRKVEPHWNYFLTLEQDVQRLSRFIEFDEKNFKCFSVEIARLLLAASAEADVVCKQICEQLEPNAKAENIEHYRSTILQHYPDIPEFVVMLPRYGLEKLKPWSNWLNSTNPPKWWTAHNRVKHHRHTQFHQGNLKNALNAVAGLFVMVLYLYKEKAVDGELGPDPEVFRVGAAHSGVVVRKNLGTPLESPFPDSGSDKNLKNAGIESAGGLQAAPGHHAARLDTYRLRGHGHSLHDDLPSAESITGGRESLLAGAVGNVSGAGD